MSILINKKSKIIAIPFAGGNRYSFDKIEKHILQDFEWITLELPGRGSRFSEHLLNNISDMVDDLYRNIQTHIKAGDYVLYGHSMGTLLGYELIKKLIKNGLKLPICLFFTGRGAPQFSRFTSKKSVLAQDPFWKEINKIGGMPKDILSQKDLLDLYYPILRNDFEAVENYVYTKMKTPFSIPLYIILGDEELGEVGEKTRMHEMKAWVNETDANCSFEIIPGDHFFVLKEAKTIAQKIMNVFEVRSLAMI
ncbi:MAG: alpha/beta fold hydrolase [Bacteroidota bacterium]